MSKNITAIRGMNDILPTETSSWQYVENILKQIAQSYGYKEIRFPLLENTDLFVRTIGEVTDIVEKEMYTFTDKSGDSLTLRPEGTASCVRAGIQHGLLYNQTQRLWYMGPMFRHERPQKGRLRQFHQLGVEAFGFKGPDIDAELLLLSQNFWRALNIADKVTLKINTLGTLQTRALYRSKLVDYFAANFELLDEESKTRLHKNPLRILDSKNPALQELIQKAPKILDSLDDESKTHFTGLLHLLDALGLKYVVDPCLVRGLDYYGLTVFEWVTNEAKAQNAICAGGHYDGLVEQLGGKSTFAAGFALGLERLIALVSESQNKDYTQNPDIYFITLGEKAEILGFTLAETLRTKLQRKQIVVNCGSGDLAKQLKKADKSGAKFAVIIGDQEVATNSVIIKNLRDMQNSSQQQIIEREKLGDFFAKNL